MLKEKIIPAFLLCLVGPVAVIAGAFFFREKQFYITALIVIGISFLLFFIKFRNKKLQTRELVIMASITALSVASRVAFFQLPQVKPMCAILIMAAVVFGKETGFFTGALSVFLSNIFFGQGAFTPFQMLGMALCVYVTALVCEKEKIKKSPLAVSVAGGIACFLIYGLIVDFSSVVLMTKNFSLASILAVYSSGLVFNLIHGVTTFLILLFAYKSVSEKLLRIKTKYGLFEGACQ